MGSNGEVFGQALKEIILLKFGRHRATCEAKQKVGGIATCKRHVKMIGEKPRDLLHSEQRAIALIREALALANETMAKDCSEYAACLARNRISVTELGAHADAEPLLRQCVAIRKTKESNAWRTFIAVSLLGEALRGQKKYAEAEPLLREGYAGMERREAAIDPASKIRLADAADRLIQLYLQMNKPDQVKKWQAERAKYPTVAPNVIEKK